MIDDETPTDEEREKLDIGLGLCPNFREALGRKVREVWVEWAREQPDPKPSHLLPWEALDEPNREVDRRIGSVLYAMGAERRTRWQRQRDGEYSAAVLEIEKLRQRLANLLGVGPEKRQGLEER